MIETLLIEDSETDAELIRALLGDHVRLTSVETLAESAGLVADVILLDLMLSDSDGSETVIKCRDLHPDKPIVVLTHLDDAQVQANCLTSGADWFFRKGESSAKTILRAFRASIEAHAIRASIRGEVEVTRSYLAKAKRLLIAIEERLANLETK